LSTARSDATVSTAAIAAGLGAFALGTVITFATKRRSATLAVGSQGRSGLGIALGSSW
jgi:hypothetical protein